MSHVIVMYHVSHVTRVLSRVTNANSHRPSPPANSPNMHSRLIHQERPQKTKKKSKLKKSAKPYNFLKIVFWLANISYALFDQRSPVHRKVWMAYWRGQRTVHNIWYTTYNRWPSVRTLQLIDWKGLGADSAKIHYINPKSIFVIQSIVRHWNELHYDNESLL